MSYMFRAETQRGGTGAISDDAITNVVPYGGTRVNQISESYNLDLDSELSDSIPAIAITTEQAKLLCLIATGALSPVNRLMTLDESIQVIKDRKLDNGLPWGEVITLSIKADQVESEALPEHITLKHGGKPVAIVEISEIFNLSQLCQYTKKTNPVCFGFNEHSQGHSDLCIAGQLWVLMSPADIQNKYGLHTPDQAINKYSGKNNLAIFGMTPWCRTSEYVLKTELEHNDSVLLFRENKLPGAQSVKKNYIRQAGDLVLDNYVPNDHLLQIDSIIPDISVTLRCLMTRVVIAQNYGCDSVRISANNNVERAMLKQFVYEISHSGVWIPRIYVSDATSYCDECESVVTSRSCPHDNEKHTCMDDVRLADMLLHGKMLPSYIARPAVSRLLAKGSIATITHEKTRYIFPHKSAVTKDTRSLMSGHQAAVLWMTGLSGSGKSTIANIVDKQLLVSGHRVYILDGDSLRNGLCNDLGFSQDDRQENIRRAGETAKLMCDAGMIVIASFISPFLKEREKLRRAIGKQFHEVYIEADLLTCEDRDPKGLYQRARDGVIKDFTGISSPYEPPINPDIHVNTANGTPEQGAQKIMEFLESKGLLRNGSRRSSNDQMIPFRPHVLN